nr:hypothetical protein [Chlamydiota bacterium]
FIVPAAPAGTGFYADLKPRPTCLGRKLPRTRTGLARFVPLSRQLQNYGGSLFGAFTDLRRLTQTPNLGKIAQKSIAP